MTRNLRRCLCLNSKNSRIHEHIETVQRRSNPIPSQRKSRTVSFLDEFVEVNDTIESEQEDPSQYKVGGYHPTVIGEIFNKRYKAKKKIGWGFFSIVWMVQDIRGGRIYALKISKSAKIFTETALDEIRLHSSIVKVDPENTCGVVRMIEHFVHIGPHGRHICLVFELLDHSNMLAILHRNKYSGIPIKIVKQITRQILYTLHTLHDKCGIIHTDIKPENVMLYTKIGTVPRKLATIPENPKCKIVDLGNGCWIDRHFSSVIQTREYRSPEVLLGYQYSTTADIWSLGCTVFELITGDVLFSPKKTENFSKTEDHLALITELIGGFPSKYLIESPRASKYIDSEAHNRHNVIRFKHIHDLQFWSLNRVLIDKYNIDSDEAENASNFIMPMLEINHTNRPSAIECLSHPWIKEM